MFPPSVSCDYGLMEFTELTKHQLDLLTEQNKIVSIKAIKNSY